MELLVGVVMAIFMVGLALTLVPILVYLERKISGYIQGRIGPNRVNFELGHVRYLLPAGMRDSIAAASWSRIKIIPGSLQPLADAVKLAFKEEIIPARADKLLWHLGPALAVIPTLAALAFIPFGAPFEIGPGEVLGVGYGHHVIDLRVASANMGVLALLAVGSLAVYGIAVGGWGSGSKFPLMGAVRAAAQMVSYEVAMGIALLSAMATAGSLDGQEFVRAQATTWGGLGWLVFKQPLACLIFLVAMFAENNRLPFDLPEAEPELVGGYHTEYTGLKFALFFMGEYAAMVVMASLFVTVFLGGWSLPWIIDANGLGIWTAVGSFIVFLVKLMAVLVFQIWIRWTLPRFRYDQLMSIGWKILIPLALLNLVATAVVTTYWPGLWTAAPVL